MKLSAYATALFSSLLLLLGEQAGVLAYYPPECFERHARDDLNRAALVVIGRVTGIQRLKVETDPAREPQGNEPVVFCYLATVTVGKTIRGEAKPGDEILFFTGIYEQREVDEVQPTLVRVANTHPGWTLDCNRVYLLALNQQAVLGDELRFLERRDGKLMPADIDKTQIWVPRSCHYSVHELSNQTGPEQHGGDDGDLVPHVDVYFDRWTRPTKRSRVPLEEFLAAQANGEFPVLKETVDPAASEPDLVRPASPE